MSRFSMFVSGRAWRTAGAVVAVLVSACSSNDGSPGAEAGTCATPGGFTQGPADDHCAAPDGGTTVVTVDPAVCNQTAAADGGDAGTDEGCPFGATMFSTQTNTAQADDDDCKYHVNVTALTPVCEGSVTFRVVATRLSDGSALTGAATGAEAFTTTPGDWDADTYCDDQSSHLSPTNNGAIVAFTENPPGTYTGSFVFDKSGPWTVRFHFFESCFDAPDSPHGHAAFHFDIP